MTPAEHARNAAISMEVKKNALRQTQGGTWKITFTVQGIDMDERITRAPMGTRFVAVLVEIDDIEQPVPAKEPAPTPGQNAPKPDRVKREKMDWRDVQPAAQAGIRCEEPAFKAFLDENHTLADWNGFTTAEAVRTLCGVKSRSELSTNHAARVIWHQLDAEYQAWLHAERVGA